MKVIWGCRECGHSQAKWTGSCPCCKNWNTLVEEQVIKEEKRFIAKPSASSKAIPICDITTTDFQRMTTKMGELDRLLGGGLVHGSLSLVGGEPGVGKSTLMLQIASSLSMQGLTVLYISGEESAQQTSLRAKRLKVSHKNLIGG